MSIRIKSNNYEAETPFAPDKTVAHSADNVLDKTVGHYQIVSPTPKNNPVTGFAGQYFLQFVVPLIAVGASIFLKYVSRNDSHKAFRKEDLAVGLDLAVTALLLFVTTGSKTATDLTKSPGDLALTAKLASLPWIICGLLVGIWVLSTAVRKKGWVGDGSLDTVWGIVVPDVFGVIALLFAVNWIS